MPNEIPSLTFCLTGILEPNEPYNQLIHNYGRTISERAPLLLEWYSRTDVETWFNNNTTYINEILTTEQVVQIWLVLFPVQPPAFYEPIEQWIRVNKNNK